MSFDPTFPPTGAGLVSADWRAQFNSLKALYDAQQTQLTTQAAQIAAHDTAISQRIKTSDAVAIFAGSVSGLAGDATAFDDPPTQAQIEAFRDKFNEALTRLQTI